MVAATADAFWTTESRGRARAVFAAEGIRCAACTRTIERVVSALSGVERVSANAATARISVDWRVGEVTLAQILRAIDRAGFRPVPLAGEASEAAFQRERRQALKRIGLAGIGMMQVMMYVLGVYVAGPDEIDPDMASYLNYVAMLITTPVLLYSGAPFLQGALKGLRQRALNMDVTVSLALVLAFAASAFNTIRGEGQTYFDSVTMFIFFLGAGRYVEMTVRHRSLSTSDALSRSLPATASRLRGDGTSERVPLQALVPGDRVVVAKGAVIPADSELVDAETRVDESLVTGESAPLQRQAGEILLGGSVNVGRPVAVIVRRDVASSALASIVALLERAQRERPQVAQAADRVASLFVAGILVLTAIVAIAWWVHDPSRAFPAVLAVLVVTCPCALSLATPAAVAAATTRLARAGLLVTRGDALERLAGIDTIVLDKTGTLTSGSTVVAEVVPLGSRRREEVLAVAAALERGSDHPLARAFEAYADPALQAQDVVEWTGQGIEGRIDGELWRLGRPEFVQAIAACAAAPADAEDALWLGNTQGPVARIVTGEELRPDARPALAEIRALGITPTIASGDRAESVTQIASSLDICGARSRLRPQDKIALVRELRNEGRRVLMIGDGVNDGPVLAAADVSCAMGQGSAVAQAAADLLLLNDSLRALATGVKTARRMLGVIRQNFRWALAYNFAAVPLAALDLVPPWLAALGMSMSSMIVVLNASRLARTQEER